MSDTEPKIQKVQRIPSRINAEKLDLDIPFQTTEIKYKKNNPERIQRRKVSYL